jgi:hypothetical protein
LKLNGIHQLLVYADDVNILGGSAHTIKENAEALVAASKEIGLDVNADKTKYMFMSRDQTAGQSQYELYVKVKVFSVKHNFTIYFISSS